MYIYMSLSRPFKIFSSKINQENETTNNDNSFTSLNSSAFLYAYQHTPAPPIERYYHMEVAPLSNVKNGKYFYLLSAHWETAFGRVEHGLEFGNLSKKDLCGNCTS